MMKKLLIALLLPVLASCASVEVAVLKAGTSGADRFDKADVEAAIAIAKASGDKAGEACFVAISKKIDVSPKPEAVGLLSKYESLRVARKELNAPLDAEVHQACSPLVVDASTFAQSFINKLRVLSD
jgi:hypothetical protein